MKKTKITAIIPTLNEEVHIEDAIKSVRFADEIIVIDSFSTDKTVALAKKHQVTLIQRVFDDFSTQKNFAIDKAKYDWIYILDADERVTPKLEKEILEAVKNPKEFAGFYIRRTFYFMNKKINYGGAQRDKVVRLFLKSKCKYNGNFVHELIEVNGELGFLKNKLDHFSYRGFDQYLSKINHYSTLRAKELHQKGKHVNVYHFLVKPLVRFLIHYVIRFGFLDGFQGFVMAKMQAFGVLTRYIKLRILNNKTT